MLDKFDCMIEVSPWLDRFLQIKEKVNKNEDFDSIIDEFYTWVNIVS